MSELDVIVIHIRGEQAEEYERLFAERIVVIDSTFPRP